MSNQIPLNKSETAISSKIVINFYIVIWFGESSYLVLTISHSFRTHFVLIMASVSDMFGLPLAILTMSMNNVDFIDPEAEAHMEKEGECKISGAGARSRRNGGSWKGVR